MRKIILNIITIVPPVLLVLLYYNYYATSGHLWSVKCTFHDITGFLCPGCGGQRAFYNLLHGNILLALRYNILITVLFPLLLVCYFIITQTYIVKSLRFQKYLSLKPWHAYAILTVLFLFFILRNIPFYPFTLLAPPQ